MLRLAADTNTVVSALLWHGAPHRLFEAIEAEELFFYASRALIDELAEVLARRKLAHAVRASGRSVLALVAHYRGLVEMVRPRALRRRVGRDPDDEAVIACALAAHADLIVSGDQDLLVLKTYRHVRIVSAAEALRIIAAEVKPDRLHPPAPGTPHVAGAPLQVLRALPQSAPAPAARAP